MKKRKIYTLEKLKSLKVGDAVFLHYKSDDDNIKTEATIILIENGIIYFDNGFDFPLSDSSDHILAMQDTGDYIFEIYEL